jgi:phage terminase large subunit-like protein
MRTSRGSTITSSGRVPSRRLASRRRTEPNPYYFDRAAAERICAFFAKYLVFTKGEWAGQPFVLQPWQRKILSTAFGWKRRADRLRRYRTVYIEIAKKNGKSELAAGVALYLTLCDDEPGAMVYSAAADKSQAAIVFEPASLMCELSPELKKRCKIFREEIFVDSTMSFYRVLSADVQSKHGLNPHGIIFDELHAQDNRELWDTLRGGRVARRQPMTFALTTAGVDKKTICGELHDKARAILNGTAKDDTFLPVIYAVGEKEDWEDPELWKKANPNLGVSVKLSALEEEYAEAKRSPAYQNTFRRMHCNQWVRQVHRWIDLKKWRRCAGPVPWNEMLEHLKGRPCYAGLDLSTITDLSALVLLFDSTIRAEDPDYPSEQQILGVKGAQLIPNFEYGDPLPAVDLLSFFWCPEEGILERSKRDQVSYDVWRDQGAIIATEGDAVDHGAIRKMIQDLGREFPIQEIAVDAWNAHKLITELEAEDGFTVARVSQGFGAMTAPTKELDVMYRRGQLRHGGHPVLEWNADNAALDKDPYDNWKVSKKKSRERIDGIVALVMALSRLLLSEGKIENARIEVLGG